MSRLAPRASRGQPAAADGAARPRGEPTIELGVTGSHQNAPPATSARANPGERALTGTDDAGGVFCHADVRVGGLAAATHQAAAALLRYSL